MHLIAAHFNTVELIESEHASLAAQKVLETENIVVPTNCKMLGILVLIKPRVFNK